MQPIVSLARGPLFYGWWVVLAALVGAATGVSVVTAFAFGPFILPFQEEFGWSRGEISTAVVFSTVSFVIVSPLFGIVLDKYGVRRLLILSTLLMGLLIASLYTMNGAIWQFYLAYLLLPIVGAGTSPIAYSKLIVHWFDRRRGLALGVGLAGIGVGAAILPALIQFFIENSGWRWAYVCLGGLILTINLPLAWLLVYNAPEAHGMLPDGDPQPTACAGATSETGLSVGEGIRSRSFWLMSGAFILVGVAFLGVIVHLVPLLVDRGMPSASAAAVASTLGVALMSGRILAGYLMDKFFAPHVVICFFMGPVIGIALLAMGANGSAAYLAATLIGIAVGAEFDVIAFFTSRYFGFRAYGRIYGLLYAAFTLGGGVGPVLMGVGFDALGSYTQILWVLCAAVVIAIALVARLGPYLTDKSAV